MNKTVVCCSNCGGCLFETAIPESRRGIIASIAKDKGYIVKMPCFYGHSRFEIFCSKECKNEWFEANIPNSVREEGDKITSELSAKFEDEKFINGLAGGLDRIQRIFKNRGLI